MAKTARPPQALMNAALFFVLMFAITESFKAQAKLESVYSDLSESKCKTIEVEKETGSSTQRCPGVAGYKLLVLDDDARQSITVISPDGKNHPLDFWHVVTHAFSIVGNKAEWRVTRGKGQLSPVALIVRVKASESGKPMSQTSYLAVVKVTPEKICVTHKILPGAKANENARNAADSAQAAACLKEVDHKAIGAEMFIGTIQQIWRHPVKSMAAEMAQRVYRWSLRNSRRSRLGVAR